jgi:hypothetical protein
VLGYALAVVLTAASGSGSVAETLDEADTLLGQFKYQEAINILTAALEQPESTLTERAGVYVRIGIARFSMGDEQGATAVFKEALALDANTELPKLISPKISRIFERLQGDIQAKQVTVPDWQKNLGQPDGGIGDTLPPPPPEKNRLPTYIAGGAAVALLAAGAYFGSRAQVEQEKAQGAEYGSDAAAYNASAQSNATTANVMFGVGATSAAAALVFFWVF